MKKSALLTVYLVIFLDMLGFGVLIPVVRDLTQILVSNSGLGWPRPEIYMGILMAAYSGAQMVSSPILGRLSDRWGRKSVFLISALGNVLSYVIWVLSNQYWMFLFGRVLSGITGGNIAIAQSILADHTTPAERPRAMGLLGACIGMGFVLGPFLGGLLINFNQFKPALLIDLNPFWLIGAVCLCLSLISFVLIAVGRFGADRNGGETRSPEGFAVVASFFGNSSQRSVYATQLLSQLSFVAFEVLFAWILQKQYHFDLRETFYFFGVQGLILAFVQGGLYRRMEKKRPPEYWVRLGLLGSCVGMALLPWAGYVDGFISAGLSIRICLLTAILLLLSLASGFGGPSLNAYASIHSPKNEQGRTMGNMQGLAALARFAAPIAATSLYAVWLPAPFLLGAGLCLGAWWVFLRIRIA